MNYCIIIRSGSRTAATTKMELFVIIVNDWKPLTIIRKCSIFDVAAGLDPPLIIISSNDVSMKKNFDLKKLALIRKAL